MTPAFLDRFVDCQPDTPCGLRNTAMLTLGYELLARRSELLTIGHDTAATMRACGWKSVNVLGRYLEHAEHNVWM